MFHILVVGNLEMHCFFSKTPNFTHNIIYKITRNDVVSFTNSIYKFNQSRHKALWDDRVISLQFFFSGTPNFSTYFSTVRLMVEFVGLVNILKFMNSVTPSLPPFQDPTITKKPRKSLSFPQHESNFGTNKRIILTPQTPFLTDIFPSLLLD